MGGDSVAGEREYIGPMIIFSLDLDESLAYNRRTAECLTP